MSVLLETSLGDLTIDLHCDLAPKATQNFLKLCAVKYYNDVCFHRVQKGFVIECGDPSLPLGAGPATVSAATAAASVAAANAAAAAAASASDSAPLGAAPSARPASTRGGDSIWGLLYGAQARCFPYLPTKALTHSKRGCVSMMPTPGSTSLHASTFLITLTDGLGYLDASCTPIGQVVEGLEDFISALDGVLLSPEGVPAQNIRIRHTIVLEDPTPAVPGLDALVPPASPVPIVHPFDFEVLREEDAREAERAATLTAEALEAERLAKESHSKAVVLEMLGDLPDADAEPPPNVLFVCKLNPCTRSSDLELIFSRFGGLKSCDIITDPKTGASLQYAFLEFETAAACEQAYFKMNNTLIDERRIKVDFSQSVSKQWNQFRRNKMQKIKSGGGAVQKTSAATAAATVKAAAIQPAAPLASARPLPPTAASVALSAAASSSSASSTAAGATASESSRHHSHRRSRSPGRHSSSSHHRDHRSRDESRDRDRDRDRSSSHHHSSSSSGSHHRDRHDDDRHRSRRDEERSGGGHSSSSRRDRSRSRSRDRDRKHRERSRSPRQSEHSSSDRSRDRR